MNRTSSVIFFGEILYKASESLEEGNYKEAEEYAYQALRLALWSMFEPIDSYYTQLAQEKRFEIFRAKQNKE